MCSLLTLPLPLGHVGRQPLLDVIFTSSCSPTAGPFSSVPEFHDWFTSTFGASTSEQNRSPHHTARPSQTTLLLYLRTPIYTQAILFYPLDPIVASFQSSIGINQDGIQIIGSTVKLGGPHGLAKNGSPNICLCSWTVEISMIIGTISFWLAGFKKTLWAFQADPRSDPPHVS